MRFHLPLPRLLAPVVLALAVLVPAAGQSVDRLPAALSNQDFWSLTSSISEPNGYFRSRSGSPDNLLSNERTISTMAAALVQRVKDAGVYLGVGPEQNFTYLSAIRPRFAFIIDVRRGNLQLHLLYKALFEMSPSRADFVARLFTRTRPAGLTTASTARDLMTAYRRAPADNEAAFKANLTTVIDHLTRTRELTLDAEDRAGIEYIYRNFFTFGPDIYYTSSIGGRPGSAAMYADLMTATDSATGDSRTYLATEANYLFVRTMESNNLIVPIVGDFAGPRALRLVGTFLKDRGATVSAFYVSNVEEYLRQNGVWDQFCANVAALPLTPSSTFIRSGTFGSMAGETRSCAGR